jgi:thiamine transport system substrate-binding protein
MKQTISTLFKFISLTVVSSFVLTAASYAGGAKDAPVNAERAKEVVVYTYDSFAGKWGPGPELTKKFEAASGYRLTLVNCGDAAQAFSKAVLEKSAPQADVIIGIDNNLAAKARKADIFVPYKPANADSTIAPDLENVLGGSWLLTPYDYGEFAIIYDTQSSVPAPASLEDLTKPEYEKKLILMDPRTSTPGLGFAAWTVAVFGDKYADYWKALKPSILTMAPGWSAGYGLFTKGEAPLVISYTTSPAYHVEYDKTDRYKALIFAEGHTEQVEGAGILKGAQNMKGAKAFMDYLITEEAQNILPLTQWMYPANGKVTMPDSYAKAAPHASKLLTADSSAVDTAVPVIMDTLGK